MFVHRINHRLASTGPALTLALGLGLAAPFGLAISTEAATPSAHAAVQSGTGGLALFYTAASGQTNRLTLTETHDGQYLVYVIDDSVPISVGSGCTHPDSADLTKISCSVEKLDARSPYYTLEMNLRDRNDTVRTNNATDQTFYGNSIDLGSGNDTSISTGIIDGSYTYGNAGADTLTVGRRGFAEGGDGNDTFYTGGYSAGADGGKGNDVIHGGAGTQSLRGGDGNDTISGSGSADYLYGGRGNDRLYGGKGNDTLYGNSGNDRLYGNAGNDHLYGGPGNDTIHQE